MLNQTSVYVNSFNFWIMNIDSWRQILKCVEILPESWIIHIHELYRRLPGGGGRGMEGGKIEAIKLVDII